ncbi:MAG TPA: C4-type zinc ribbon domain-containing protein [Acidimicrobiales bacterium]|nr:C4-type zinc ribbon domain-containing protein [Acidimicrobiales bacterium]
MADPFDTLIEVQEHDTALDQLRHRIDTLPERLELREVEKRQRSLEAAAVEVKTQVDDLAGRQRLLEERIEAAAKRRHEIEQRMESGEVSASRDLQAMDHEVHHLSARQAQFEEEEIALLEEEEPFDSLLVEHEAAASSLAAEAGRLSVAIDEAEGEIRLSIAEEERLRAESASRLPDDLAARYEKLRARLGGVGAARLVGDRCDGCHLTLPSVEFERIRHLAPGEFATCPQCDRILVH